MRKFVIGASIAAVCAIPMAATAGTTLYGTLSYSLNSVDDDGAVTGSTDGISGRDNVSLFGLKGSYGEGTKAFFHLQTGAPSEANNAFNQRFYFGGLKGGFGSIAYGRMTNMYKMPGFQLDPFYNLSHMGAGGTFAAGGATYGLSGATNGFTDSALQYETPNLGVEGLKVAVGMYADDTDADEHAYAASISYNAQGINAGVVFATNGETGVLPGIQADGDAIRVYGGYSMDAFKVAASFESIDDTVDASDDANTFIYVTGTFMAKAINTDFSASVGMVDMDNNEGMGVNVGAFYHIAENTNVHAIYSIAMLDDADLDPSVISIGATHKFSLGGN